MPITLPLTERDFILTQNSEMWIDLPGADFARPEIQQITVGATAVAIGDITIAVTALTKSLYKGWRLHFGGVEVETTKEGLPGEVSLSVFPIYDAIPAATTATLVRLNDADVTVTVGASGPADNASIISTVALTDYLYPNTRLVFGGTTVTLAADAKKGDTTIQINPSPAVITTGKIAYTYGLIPLYSVASSSPSVTPNMVESRNWAAGLWTNQKVTKRTGSAQVSGTFVINDPGYVVIQKAALGTRSLYFEQFDPTGNGEYGRAFISNFGRTRNTDQNVDLTFTLAVDGKLYFYIESANIAALELK